MSRAFVKEQDETRADDLPDRLISPHPNLVTAEGLRQIEAEVARQTRQQAEAQSSGNREALALAARELRYWTQRRATAEVIAPPKDAAAVHFGSKVTIRRDDGRRQTYRIVGEDEADPAKGTLSYVSPLAMALMGKKVGATVRAGPSPVELLEIV